MLNTTKNFLRVGCTTTTTNISDIQAKQNIILLHLFGKVSVDFPLQKCRRDGNLSIPILDSYTVDSIDGVQLSTQI